MTDELCAGTVGHNPFRTHFVIDFGGLKRSGLRHEGGIEGLSPCLVGETMILEGRPEHYSS